LATNLDNPRCGNAATQTAYKTGIAYALQQLQTTHATLYIDAAHGGWLGWDDNLGKFMQLFSAMGVNMGGVRGFAQNVANYQDIGTMCPWKPDSGTRNGYCLQSGSGQGDECCADACNLASQWNPCVNEMNFAQALSKAAQKYLEWSPINLIDTSRNGIPDARADCANWCNPRNMGAGPLPTTSTGSPLVDALFWLKTPGESDGCTEELPDGSSCPRYDTMCGSADSIGSQSGEPRAPEAGAWFDFQVKQLAANAVDTNWPAPIPTPTPSPPSPSPPTPSPPTPSPSGDCPGGSLTACTAACSVVTGAAYDACISVCQEECPSTTTEAPAPAPAPPAPSPSPSGCPGGSLSACISNCPTNPTIFAVCVAHCHEECAPTTTTPAPAPAGMCCWQDCQTMSTCLPSDACSNDEDSCLGCSGIWCPASASFLV